MSKIRMFTLLSASLLAVFSLSACKNQQGDGGSGKPTGTASTVQAELNEPNANGQVKASPETEPVVVAAESPTEAPKATEPTKPAPARSANYEDLLDQPIGEHVTETKEVKYVEGEAAHARHVLDLYMPKGKANVPVIVFVHGGMWSMFDKRHGKAISRGVSTHGYGVVSINYRLAAFTGDQARYPDFVEDCAAAVAWVHKNVAAYGGDPKKIFLSGHSAGGHIAGLVAYDGSYLEKHGLKHTEVVRGFIGISGAYDIPTSDDPDPAIAGMANMIGFAFDPDAETRRKASPSQNVEAEEPPALLLYAERELFKLDLSTQSLDAKLQEAKVARAKRMIAGRTHQSILGEFGTEADAANQATVDFITGVLGGTFRGDPELVPVGNGNGGANGNGNGKDTKPAESAKPASKDEGKQ